MEYIKTYIRIIGLINCSKKYIGIHLYRSVIQKTMHFEKILLNYAKNILTYFFDIN